MPDVVNVKNFLLSVRETGYRSFAHSIAEFIDNSLQAGATRVSVNVGDEKGEGSIVITDNGQGMSLDALRTALQFGGSTRFNDRTGTGRFGMGLPTSSVSLARRVDIYTWGGNRSVLHAYLDIDELHSHSAVQIPEPKHQLSSPFSLCTKHGTTIMLSKCDRTGRLSETASLERMKFELRRIFRGVLNGRFRLTVNGERLQPFDPLFLASEHNGVSAGLYGPELQYHLPVGNAGSSVKVRFSELPVAAWRTMSNTEKQTLGISRGAGVSIVRCGREIAYGWYFLGTKRRENYDDWWRCEVSFGAELDEYFGVNHTKQQISPTSDLDRLLTPDIENIARTLNSRVRQEFVRTTKPKRPAAAKSASARDKFLPSLMSSENEPLRAVTYRIEIDAGMVDNTFYRVDLDGDEAVVFLNPHHPITPSYIAAKDAGESHVGLFEYAILAAARAELGAGTAKARWWFRHFRAGWSDALAAFLGN